MRRFHLTSLISGIAFIALGVMFLLERLGVVDISAGLGLPVLLIAFGAWLLLSTSRPAPSDVEPPATAEATEPLVTDPPAARGELPPATEPVPPPPPVEPPPPTEPLPPTPRS